MPYHCMVCKSCDMLVHNGDPHGPGDQYCEGEDGYEFIDLWTEQEIRDGRAARAIAAKDAATSRAESEERQP